MFILAMLCYGLRIEPEVIVFNFFSGLPLIFIIIHCIHNLSSPEMPILGSLVSLPSGISREFVHLGAVKVRPERVRDFTKLTVSVSVLEWGKISRGTSIQSFVQKNILVCKRHVICPMQKCNYWKIHSMRLQWLQSSKLSVKRFVWPDIYMA